MNENVPEFTGRNVGSPTGTNNQVPNVDEADIIKTDPNRDYIYSISRTKLSIFSLSNPQSPSLTSVVNLSSFPSNFPPSDILVEGNYLAVFGTILPSDSPGYTQIVVYDISNKANPSLLVTYKFDG